MANNYPNKQKYRLDLNRPLTWNEGDENERYPTQWEVDRPYKEGQVVLYDDSYVVGNTAYGALSFFQCKIDHTGEQPGLPQGSTTNPSNNFWIRVGSVDASGVGPAGPAGPAGPGSPLSPLGPCEPTPALSAVAAKIAYGTLNNLFSVDIVRP